jgi:hypothetical protein
MVKCASLARIALRCASSCEDPGGIPEGSGGTQERKSRGIKGGLGDDANETAAATKKEKERKD